IQSIILRQLNLLNTLIAELRDELNVLIESILFIKQKIIHPNVITPEGLKTELEKIKLRPNLFLPFSPHDFNNIYTYFTLCNLSAFFEKGLLIFAIKIPLVSETSYNLYHLLPLPALTSNPNVFSIIDPQYPYLLISTTRTKYAQLRNKEKCTVTGRAEYICSDLVTYSSTQVPVCETQLFASPISMPADCLTRTLKANLEIWHPLQPNVWLFTVTNPTPASISCDEAPGQIQDVQIIGSGTLSLRPRCQLYTFSTALTSSSNTSANFTNFVPRFNISLDNCCFDQSEFLNKNPTFMKPISITGLNLDDLKHTKHKLDQFQETLQSSINKPHIVPHSPFYQSYIAFTVFLLILFFMYIFCCKCCNCHCLPFIGKFWPRSNANAPIDLSKICITNINLTRNWNTRAHFDDSGDETEQI
ncbi:uncharacterized protein, partial [Bemisia tabaci]|uniref:uncharacterized protein n=1 Tax=Bemisia tabaci TaxID=7038 RepID=UPI003B27D07A